MQINVPAAKAAIRASCEALAASLGNGSPLFARVINLGREMGETLDALAPVDLVAEIAEAQRLMLASDAQAQQLRDELRAAIDECAALRSDRDALAQQLADRDARELRAATAMDDAARSIDEAQGATGAPA